MENNRIQGEDGKTISRQLEQDVESINFYRMKLVEGSLILGKHLSELDFEQNNVELDNVLENLDLSQAKAQKYIDLYLELGAI